MCCAGKVIKNARINEGLTQMELGKLLGHTTGQFIYHLEIGKAPVPASLITELCKILKIDPDRLINAALKDQKKAFEKAVQKFRERAKT
jgi:transcriptional regulator with XRE-family HTH domain